MKQHVYETQVDWTGNDGPGTSHYTSYRRDHVIFAPQHPPIPASSDPSFRGDASRYNPEQLLVAALSSCHMLWYLHLCAVNGVNVVNYRSAATGWMDEHADGSGEFVRVLLKPNVTVTRADDISKAQALHAEAHRFCFIARSVKFPVEISAEITATTE